jgi:hypothetical protein
VSHASAVIDVTHDPDVGVVRVAERVRALVREFSRVRTMAVDVDPDLARSLAVDLAHVRDLDLALTRARTRRRIKDPGRLSVLVLDLKRGAEQAFGRAGRHHAGFARDRSRALAVELAVLSDFDARVGRELDELAGEVAAFRTTAAAWSRSDRVDGCRSATGSFASGLVARRLVDVASCVVPVVHRERYREEWRSELHELAAIGRSRQQQLTYAVRLLTRAWEVRFELRAASTYGGRS